MAKNPHHSEKQQFPRPPHNKTEKTYATKKLTQTVLTTKPKNGPPSHTTAKKKKKSPTSSNTQTSR
jgi:hypothetical protein